MDSITQLALGAVVGYATLGRRVGWRSLIWGAAPGTSPTSIHRLRHADLLASATAAGELIDGVHRRSDLHGAAAGRDRLRLRARPQRALFLNSTELASSTLYLAWTGFAKFQVI